MMNWKISLWLIGTIVTAATSTIIIPAENLIQDDVDGMRPVNMSRDDTDYGTNEGGSEGGSVEETEGENDEPGINEPGVGEEDYAETIIPEISTETTTETIVPDSEDIVDELLIQTQHGPMRGIQWQGSSEILAYLDIPYGKYNSSFEAPTEPDAWEEILEVSEHKTRCLQLDENNVVGSSDCLTLSIFTPASPVNTSVLFYIHESNFITGSGDPAIYGPEYLVPKNIILVLPNYRLGPLGFLCLRNSTIPGNAGLKDLALALEWTKNNIEAFGGDPSNIAVSGDGTSASLAGYLALSPKSTNLITKVITDSGSVLSPWAIDRNPIVTAERVADSIRNLINPSELPENVFESEKLLIAAKNIQMRPCIEEEGFLTDTPWNILQDKITNITFIIGSANHAGLIEALQHNETSIAAMRENFATYLPNDLVFSNNNDRNYVGDKVMRQYFTDGNITLGHSEALSLFHTDILYLTPCVRVAHALVNAGATVFLYEFSFVGLLNKELVTIEDAPQFGAVRGDIVGYLFTQDGRIPAPGTAEKRTVDLMTDLWANFLKTSEPSSTFGFTWQPINATEPTEDWLTIGDQVAAVRGLHAERLRLWSDLYRDHFIERNAASLMTARTTIIGFAILYFMIKN